MFVYASMTTFVYTNMTIYHTMYNYSHACMRDYTRICSPRLYAITGSDSRPPPRSPKPPLSPFLQALAHLLSPALAGSLALCRVRARSVCIFFWRLVIVDIKQFESGCVHVPSCMLYVSKYSQYSHILYVQIYVAVTHARARDRTRTCSLAPLP